MKKIFKLLTCVLLFAGVAACSDDKETPGEPVPDDKPVQLAKPVLAEGTVTADSFQVSWTAIENAASYACTVNGGEEVPVAETQFSQSELAGDTDYVIRVKAVSGDEKLYTDSEWAEITVHTDAVPTPDRPFIVTVSEVKPFSAVVKIATYDKSATYYYDVVSVEEWNSKTETKFKEDLLEYFAMIGQFVFQIPYPECLSEMLFHGDGETPFSNGIESGTDYFAYVIGIDVEGNFTTDFIMTPFTTPAPGVSTASVDIAFSEITDKSMRIIVTPESEVTQYYEMLILTSSMEEFIATEGQEALQDKIMAEGESCKGVDDYVWNDLEPETSYTMAVVGRDANGGIFFKSASETTSAATTASASAASPAEAQLRMPVVAF